MRRLCLAVAVFTAVPAFADEIVNVAPSSSEVGRYVVLRQADATVRLDSATGASWFLCTRKQKQAWCRAKDVPGLASGPAGRYRLAEGAPLVLLDSVTGRSWARCELPTPEKGLAWCALEE